MEISPINSINLNSIHSVLSSQKLSESEKVRFVRNNKVEIQKVIEKGQERQISGMEFQGIMNHRPLQKFKPIKNAFTKRGDKILLGLSLGIEPVEVDNYIENICNNIEEIENLNLPNDAMDKVKAYVYRHGTKEQVVKFLDWELRYAKNKLKLLYETLDYDTGGVADYFRRPIHRMDNKTLINMYNVIDDHLSVLEKTGSITAKDKAKNAEWALVRIYQIQNNSKFINAVKTLKEIK